MNSKTVYKKFGVIVILLMICIVCILLCFLVMVLLESGHALYGNATLVRCGAGTEPYDGVSPGVSGPGFISCQFGKNNTVSCS